MEYSDEEIAFVDFCSRHFRCKLGEDDLCPFSVQCEEEEGKKLCLQIVSKMRNKEDLEEEESKL